MKYAPNFESEWVRPLLVKFVWATLLPAMALAQVPVDENGEVIGDYSVDASSSVPSAETTGNENIPLLSTVDLEELVGPIALYPDDLLAIVLPASAYPLQIVDAARFLEALENDPSLEPNADWDDSVVALANYPEVIELLNDDIDWTWRLGEAVVSQQTDVVAAIETFRDRAYAAGNLKSDSYQNVTRDEGIIEIVPIADDTIYVPYYEPERVVVYQPRPVYYYYPRPRPVYYYPYSSTYAFDRGYFWGVTTAFSIGWFSDSLNVHHHSYRGHPYYGRSYWNRWWYRRPTMNLHNTAYVGGNTNVTVNRYYSGDRWQPRANRRDFVSRDVIADRRATRSRHYPSSRSDATLRREQRSSEQRSAVKRSAVKSNSVPRERNREPVQFRTRNRSETTREQRQDRVRQPQAQSQRNSRAQQRRSEPAARPQRTEATVRSRRAEPQARRAVPQQRQTSRAVPQQRQASRAAPQQRQQASRPAPQRQERAARKSPERTSNRNNKEGSARSAQRSEARSR